MKEITINDEVYVLKSDMPKESKKVKSYKGKEYVIVRTYSAGVFAGYLDSREGKEVKLLKVRRLWYRSGASSLSQLCMEGVKDISNCKFPCEVDELELTEAIEILQVTEEAKESIDSVPVWEQ